MDYLHVQVDKPWYNCYLKNCKGAGASVLSVSVSYGGVAELYVVGINPLDTNEFLPSGLTQ